MDNVNSWQPLMKPTVVAGLQLQNHLAMAPMTRHHCPGGVPSVEVADYYARRAGSLGMIITEGVYVDMPSAGAFDDVPRLDSPEALIGWKNVIDKAHAKGAKIFPQLWHLGCVRRTGDAPYPEAPVVTPSGKSLRGKDIGTPATRQQIDEIIDAFARSAVVAKETGFDGVELHGAHGYLIDQFFWKNTNARQDIYGGSIANRVRIGVEIVEEIRHRVGPDFPIQFRFSQWKGGNFDASIADSAKELEQFLLPLSQAGIDIFHPSTRRFWLKAFAGSDLTLSGWTKKITGKPTIIVGHIGIDTAFQGETTEESHEFQVDELLDLYYRDEFDLVAVGRALLADPQWVEKSLRGYIKSIDKYTKESEKKYY